tara:strand:- start:3783 stop:4685 length:903 start_codon:yes stop_codon:yes gene_type:complete
MINNSKLIKEKVNPDLYFISYGSREYSVQRRRIKYQAKKFNLFKKVIIYKKNNLPIEFQTRFKNILKNKQGDGFWIWKSCIVLETFKLMKDGDVLIYVDSGSTLNVKGLDRFKEYIELFKASKESIFLFQMQILIEKNWTTKEVFNVFNVQNNKKITETPQFMGGVFMVKKNKSTIQFFEDFQRIVDNDNKLITNHYKEFQEEYFKDCRHDQSIMSVMSKLNGCFFLKDETFFYTNPEEQYDFPILTVRDGPYNYWQRVKFYTLYPINIKKIIYFQSKKFYFNNKTTLISKFLKKISDYL